VNAATALKHGDWFELAERTECLSAQFKPAFYTISAGATGRILQAQPKIAAGCAMVEFVPPPPGCPRKYFVKYEHITLLPAPPPSAAGAMDQHT